LASTWKHPKRIKGKKWAWKKVALKMKVDAGASSGKPHGRTTQRLARLLSKILKF
jgi:hypothetical protein